MTVMPFSLLLQAGGAPGAGGALGQFLFVPVLIAIMYFIIIMPMRRHQKQQKEMIKTLQNGQTVLTSGGIIGTIVAVNDDTLILRIKPDNLKLQVTRSAVTSVVAADDQAKK
jgi:preprotein translocase subunit YajC